MRQYERKERLLTIENLSLSYGEKLVLRDINLHIDNIVRPEMSQGQVVALLGLSGSGKTQLFRCIAGLNKPSSGAVFLNKDGKPVQTTAGAVGMVQQAYPLLQHRTILSNLELAARRMGASGKAEIDRLLSHFSILDKKKNYPLELSGGQRQRVAIIQQLLCNNHFLLMDEPFSGLDPIAKRRVYDTVRAVTTAHEHNTVIFTTHDLESAVHLADEIWIIGREGEKPGATVRAKLDLVERGLAWDPEIEKNPQFWSTVAEVNNIFKTL